MESIEEVFPSSQSVSRRSLLKTLGLTAAVSAAAAALAGCGGGGSNSSSNTTNDLTILNAAATAEGLAATFYAYAIASPLFAQLSAVNQNYLAAAYEQEVAHYTFLTSNGATALTSGTSFYFPTGTFGSGASNNQITFNTLEIIEDILIATYLIGVNNFSTTTNKLYAAQILGVDSEHRVIGRVIANALGITTTANLAPFGDDSSTTPLDYEFERQFSSPLTNGISSVTSILTNNFQTAGASGNSTTPYSLTVSATLNGVSLPPQDNTVESN